MTSLQALHVVPIIALYGSLAWLVASLVVIGVRQAIYGPEDE